MACHCSTKTASNCQSTYTPYIDTLVTCTTFQSPSTSPFNFLFNNKLNTSNRVLKKNSLRTSHSHSKPNSSQTNSYQIVDNIRKSLVKFVISLISSLFICLKYQNFHNFKEFFLRKLKRKDVKAVCKTDTDETIRTTKSTIHNSQSTFRILKRTSPNSSSFHSTNRSNQLSIYCFFFLWPFIFLVYLFSNSSNLLNCSIKNGTFQFFIIFNLLLSNLAIPITANRNPNKISIQGDLILGGIFPVHQKGNKPDTFPYNSTNHGALCGPINKDRGIQRVEAMLFALDKINHNQSILPTIKLGAIILDTCASDTYALNQSLEFIRASVNTVESSAFECADKSQPKSKYNTKIITGVVGGSYSEVSLQVANLLRLFRIPQVSYASTTTSLSDKTRYDFFARTVPPDVYQARALVDIVASFNWTYVSIVSSEGQYGDSGLTAFIRNARNRNICIAANEKITHSANTSSFDQIIESISSKPNAKGVVLFLRMEDARGLLLAAKRAGKQGQFTWIAADGWGKEVKLVENVEEIALGAITVELQSETIAEFDSYFKKLSLKATKDSVHKVHQPITSDKNENTRNPWFREYWQEVFQCQLPDEHPTALALNKENEELNDPNELMFGDQPSSDDHETNNFIFSLNPHHEFGRLEQMYENAYNRGDKEMLKRLEMFQKIKHQLKQDNLNNKQRHRNGQHSKLFENKFKRDDEFGNRRFKRFSSQKDQKVQQCASHLSLRDIHHKQEPKIQFVVDAVYAFAHALHNAWLVKCGGKGKVCPALRDLDGGEFYNNYLLNVSFLDPVGSLVRFDKNGDGLGRYNVYNFQKSKLQNYSTTGYTYRRIGSWSDSGLKMNKSNIFWNIKKGPNDLIPTSRCSEPCGFGQIKITQSTSDTCCWICQECKPYEFVKDKNRCEDCGHGFWPLSNKTACYELPLTYIQWTSYYALAPMILAVAGILLTLFVFITFIRHLDTPIVRASGRELSFILLFGLIWCFSMTFALLSKPTTYICALQRFGVGFGFSVVYSPLLTKTNRISRIFNSAKKTTRRPSFISPRSQVIITLALISIQVIETGIWFILEEPGVKKDVSDEKRWLVVLKCKVKDTSTLFSLAYNILLIATCTAYAFKTRKIPENYNESKFIGFTMYTTCIIWLAFIPTYFGMSNNFEITLQVLCVSISLSAYVTLFCLFGPKIYIIICHPDKNVRKLTMNSNTYKKPTLSSGIYFPSNPDTGLCIDQLKQHVTLEPASSVSNTGDSSGRSGGFQAARYPKNSHTDSTNISYNMPTVTGTDTSDSGYQNNVCVHAQPNPSSGLMACFDSQMNQNGSNRSKGFKANNNKLSVMMYMPGIAAIDRPELFYTNAPTVGSFLPGFELRKRSNSFTQGQTTANFLLPNLDLEGQQHQILYQQPFIFNNEVAQRTYKELQQQQQSSLERQDSAYKSNKSGKQTAQYNEHVNQLDEQNFNQQKINKVNFNLSNLSNHSDEEDVKELNNNLESANKQDENMTAELAERTSQSSVQLVMQVTTGEQDEESQI